MSILSLFQTRKISSSEKTPIMDWWRKPQQRLITKVITLLVTLTFVFPYLTWAFEAHAYPASTTSILFHQQIVEIPDKYAATLNTFQGGEDRLVVHVQDLHCNFEVQTNIAHIIDYVASKHNLKLVAIEGASLPINVTHISTFPNAEVRQETGKYFMRLGKMGGAEYYASAGKHPVWLDGVEDPKLYAASREMVTSFLNDESQGYVYDLRDMLDELKAEIYNPELLRLDAKKQACREGEISPLKYGVYLCRYGKRIKLELSSYPNLLLYVSKRRNVIPRKVELEQVYTESEQLDQAIRECLYTSDAQRQLDQLEERLDIMEKLLNISATPKELQAYRENPKAFQVKQVMDFIRQYNELSELTLDTDIYSLDSYLQQVRRFYQMADERSTVFVENTVNRMKEYNTKLAVLVTGGFHTDHVLKEMQARNISYLSLCPRITQEDLVNPYFALIRNRQTPLEKLLAKNQNILKLAPTALQVAHADRNAMVTEAAMNALPKAQRAILDWEILQNISITIAGLKEKGITGKEKLEAKFRAMVEHYFYKNKFNPNWEDTIESKYTLLISIEQLVEKTRIWLGFQPKDGTLAQGLELAPATITEDEKKMMIFSASGAEKMNVQILALKKKEEQGITFPSILTKLFAGMQAILARAQEGWEGLTGSQKAGLALFVGVIAIRLVGPHVSPGIINEASQWAAGQETVFANYDNVLAVVYGLNMIPKNNKQELLDIVKTYINKGEEATLESIQKIVKQTPWDKQIDLLDSLITGHNKCKNKNRKSELAEIINSIWNNFPEEVKAIDVLLTQSSNETTKIQMAMLHDDELLQQAKVQIAIKLFKLRQADKLLLPALEYFNENALKSDEWVEAFPLLLELFEQDSITGETRKEVTKAMAACRDDSAIQPMIDRYVKYGGKINIICIKGLIKMDHDLLLDYLDPIIAGNDQTKRDGLLDIIKWVFGNGNEDILDSIRHSVRSKTSEEQIELMDVFIKVHNEISKTKSAEELKIIISDIWEEKVKKPLKLKMAIKLLKLRNAEELLTEAVDYFKDSAKPGKLDEILGELLKFIMRDEIPVNIRKKAVQAVDKANSTSEKNNNNGKAIVPLLKFYIDENEKSKDAGKDGNPEFIFDTLINQPLSPEYLPICIDGYNRTKKSGLLDIISLFQKKLEDMDPEARMPELVEFFKLDDSELRASAIKSFIDLGLKQLGVLEDDDLKHNGEFLAAFTAILAMAFEKMPTQIQIEEEESAWIKELADQFATEFAITLTDEERRVAFLVALATINPEAAIAQIQQASEDVRRQIKIILGQSQLIKKMDLELITELEQACGEKAAVLRSPASLAFWITLWRNPFDIPAAVKAGEKYLGVEISVLALAGIVGVVLVVLSRPLWFYGIAGAFGLFAVAHQVLKWRVYRARGQLEPADYWKDFAKQIGVFSLYLIPALYTLLGLYLVPENQQLNLVLFFLIGLLAGIVIPIAGFRNYHYDMSIFGKFTLSEIKFDFDMSAESARQVDREDGVLSQFITKDTPFTFILGEGEAKKELPGRLYEIEGRTYVLYGDRWVDFGQVDSDSNPYKKIFASSRIPLSGIVDGELLLGNPRLRDFLGIEQLTVKQATRPLPVGAEAVTELRAFFENKYLDEHSQAAITTIQRVRRLAGFKELDNKILLDYLDALIIVSHAEVSAYREFVQGVANLEILDGIKANLRQLKFDRRLLKILNEIVFFVSKRKLGFPKPLIDLLSEKPSWRKLIKTAADGFGVVVDKNGKFSEKDLVNNANWVEECKKDQLLETMKTEAKQIGVSLDDYLKMFDYDLEIGIAGSASRLLENHFRVNKMQGYNIRVKKGMEKKAVKFFVDQGFNYFKLWRQGDYAYIGITHYVLASYPKKAIIIAGMETMDPSEEWLGEIKGYKIFTQRIVQEMNMDGTLKKKLALGGHGDVTGRMLEAKNEIARMLRQGKNWVRQQGDDVGNYINHILMTHDIKLGYTPMSILTTRQNINLECEESLGKIQAQLDKGKTVTIQGRKVTGINKYQIEFEQGAAIDIKAKVKKLENELNEIENMQEQAAKLTGPAQRDKWIEFMQYYEQIVYNPVNKLVFKSGGDEVKLINIIIGKGGELLEISGKNSFVEESTLPDTLTMRHSENDEIKIPKDVFLATIPRNFNTNCFSLDPLAVAANRDKDIKKIYLAFLKFAHDNRNDIEAVLHARRNAELKAADIIDHILDKEWQARCLLIERFSMTAYPLPVEEKEDPKGKKYLRINSMAQDVSRFEAEMVLSGITAQDLNLNAIEAAVKEIAAAENEAEKAKIKNEYFKKADGRLFLETAKVLRDLNIPINKIIDVPKEDFSQAKKSEDWAKAVELMNKKLIEQSYEPFFEINPITKMQGTNQGQWLAGMFKHGVMGSNTARKLREMATLIAEHGETLSNQKIDHILNKMYEFLGDYESYERQSKPITHAGLAEGLDLLREIGIQLATKYDTLFNPEEAESIKLEIINAIGDITARCEQEGELRWKDFDKITKKIHKFLDGQGAIKSDQKLFPQNSRTKYIQLVEFKKILIKLAFKGKSGYGTLNLWSTWCEKYGESLTIDQMIKLLEIAQSREKQPKLVKLILGITGINALWRFGRLALIRAQQLAMRLSPGINAVFRRNLPDDTLSLAAKAHAVLATGKEITVLDFALRMGVSEENARQALEYLASLKAEKTRLKGIDKKIVIDGRTVYYLLEVKPADMKKASIVIMAGGSEEKLWPLNTDQMPRQFRKFGKDHKNMLQKQIDNALAACFTLDRIFITTKRQYKKLVYEFLPPGFPRENIIWEPSIRQSIAAVALSLKFLEKRHGPDHTAIFMPADRVISGKEAINSALKSAVKGAQNGDNTVLLGVEAKKPETRFGYIKHGPETKLGAEIKDIPGFVEKPEDEQAEKIIETGDYDVNTSIFAMKVDTGLRTLYQISSGLSRVAEEIGEALEKAEDVEELFKEIPVKVAATLNQAFAEAVITNPDSHVRLMTTKGEFDWSAELSWADMSEETDDKGNQELGEGQVDRENIQNTVVYSGAGKQVIVKGLNDLVVIVEDDVVLVMPKSQATEIEQQVEKLRADPQTSWAVIGEKRAKDVSGSQKHETDKQGNELTGLVRVDEETRNCMVKCDSSLAVLLGVEGIAVTQQGDQVVVEAKVPGTKVPASIGVFAQTAGILTIFGMMGGIAYLAIAGNLAALSWLGWAQLAGGALLFLSSWGYADLGPSGPVSWTWPKRAAPYIKPLGAALAITGLMLAAFVHITPTAAAGLGLFGIIGLVILELFLYWPQKKPLANYLGWAAYFLGIAAFILGYGYGELGPSGYVSWEPSPQLQEIFQPLNLASFIGSFLFSALSFLLNIRQRQAERGSLADSKHSVQAENLSDLKKRVKRSQGPSEVLIITNGGDDVIAQKRFSSRIRELFRRDGKTTVMAHPEVVRRGQFLGLLDAIRNWVKKYGPLNKDGVSVGIMMPGKGTRMSPFTQRAHGIKPFIRMLIRTNKKGSWLTAAGASLYTWTLVAYHLKRMGFRGMAWKWGDEPQIAAMRMAAMNLDLNEADAVRFGAETIITDDLAENKEWLHMDPKTGEFKQVRRRSRKDLLERLGLQDTADAKAFIHIGSPALSYTFLEAADKVFGDLTEGSVDVDGYVFEALTQDYATWKMETAKDPDLQKLVENHPDFCLRVQAMKYRINLQKMANKKPELLENIAIQSFLAAENWQQMFDSELFKAAAKYMIAEMIEAHGLKSIVKTFSITGGLQQALDLKFNRPLNIQVVDFGEGHYWGDIGQLAKARKALWAVNDRESKDGEFARQLACIDHVKPDKWGNIVVGDSLVPQDGSVRNSVIIDTKIYGKANINGAVIVDSQLGNATIKEGSVVCKSTVKNLYMEKNAYSYSSIGNRVTIKADFVHTSIPKDPENLSEGLEDWFADSRVDVGADKYYKKKHWGNSMSTEEKFAQMRQRDAMPDAIEEQIDKQYRAGLIADMSSKSPKDHESFELSYLVAFLISSFSAIVFLLIAVDYADSVWIMSLGSLGFVLSLLHGIYSLVKMIYYENISDMLLDQRQESKFITPLQKYKKYELRRQDFARGVMSKVSQEGKIQIAENVKYLPRWLQYTEYAHVILQQKYPWSRGILAHALELPLGLFIMWRDREISSVKTLSDEELKALRETKPIFGRVNIDVVKESEIKAPAKLEAIFDSVTAVLQNNALVMHGYNGRPQKTEFEGQMSNDGQYKYVAGLSNIAVAKWFADEMGKEAKSIEPIKNRRKGAKAQWLIKGFQGRNVNVIMLQPEDTPEHRRANAKLISEAKAGDLIFRENTRFDKREEAKTFKKTVKVRELKELVGFARELTQLDGVLLYEMGVFFDTASAHRVNATNVGAAELFPVVGSRHIADFLAATAKIRAKMKAVHDKGGQNVIIAAGTKEDKIELATDAIGNIAFEGDIIRFGGSIVAAFLAEAGHKTGNNKVSDEAIAAVRRFKAKAAEYGVNYEVPLDLLVVKDTENDPTQSIKNASADDLVKVKDGNIPKGYVLVNLGPDEIQKMLTELDEADGMIAFGPMGPFDLNPKFAAKPSIVIMQKFAKQAKAGKVAVAVGADTSSLIEMAGVEDLFVQQSAGGAFISQTVTEVLIPGINAIKTSQEKFAARFALWKILSVVLGMLLLVPGIIIIINSSLVVLPVAGVAVAAGLVLLALPLILPWINQRFIQVEMQKKKVPDTQSPESSAAGSAEKPAAKVSTEESPDKTAMEEAEEKDPVLQEMERMKQILPPWYNQPLRNLRWDVRVLHYILRGIMFAGSSLRGGDNLYRRVVRIVPVLVSVVLWVFSKKFEHEDIDLENLNEVQKARLKAFKILHGLSYGELPTEERLKQIDFKPLSGKGGYIERALKGMLFGAYEENGKEANDATETQFFMFEDLTKSIVSNEPKKADSRINHFIWQGKIFFAGVIAEYLADEGYAGQRMDGVREALGRSRTFRRKAEKPRPTVATLSGGVLANKYYRQKHKKPVGISPVEIAILLNIYSSEVTKHLTTGRISVDESLKEVKVELEKVMAAGAQPNLATVRKVLEELPENRVEQGSAAWRLRALAIASQGLTGKEQEIVANGIITEVILGDRSVSIGLSSRDVADTSGIEAEEVKLLDTADMSGIYAQQLQEVQAMINALQKDTVKAGKAKGLIERLEMVRRMLKSSEKDAGKKILAELARLTSVEQPQLFEIGERVTREYAAVVSGAVETVEIKGMVMANRMVYEVSMPVADKEEDRIEKMELEDLLAEKLPEQVRARQYRGERKEKLKPEKRAVLFPVMLALMRVRLFIIPTRWMQKSILKNAGWRYLQKKVRALPESDLKKLLKGYESPIGQAYLEYSQNPDSRRLEREGFVNSMLQVLKAQRKEIERLNAMKEDTKELETAHVQSMDTFIQLASQLQVLNGERIGVWVGSWHEEISKREIWTPGVLLEPFGAGALGKYQDLLRKIGHVKFDDDSMEKRRRQWIRFEGMA